MSIMVNQHLETAVWSSYKYTGAINCDIGYLRQWNLLKP